MSKHQVWKTDMYIERICESGQWVRFTDGTEDGEYCVWTPDEWGDEDAIFAISGASEMYVTQKEYFLEINMLHYLNALGITLPDFPYVNRSRVRQNDISGLIAFLHSYTQGNYKYWVSFDGSDALELVEHDDLVLVEEYQWF